MSESSIRKDRELGPAGTLARVVGGLGLLYFTGTLDGGAWDVSWFDPLVGFLALPVATIALGLVARHYASGPVHLTGPFGHVVNLLVIVGLVANPYTAGGAGLFYGAAMLLAAWRGQRGCEGTVLSNLVLKRDDQIGCAFFLPIDAAETRLTRSTASGEREART